MSEPHFLNAFPSLWEIIRRSLPPLLHWNVSYGFTSIPNCWCLWSGVWHFLATCFISRLHSLNGKGSVWKQAEGFHKHSIRLLFATSVWRVELPSSNFTEVGRMPIMSHNIFVLDDRTWWSHLYKLLRKEEIFNIYFTSLEPVQAPFWGRWFRDASHAN